MHALRTEDQVGERQREQGLGLRQAPVVARLGADADSVPLGLLSPPLPAPLSPRWCCRWSRLAYRGALALQ